MTPLKGQLAKLESRRLTRKQTATIVLGSCQADSFTHQTQKPVLGTYCVAGTGLGARMWRNQTREH